MCQSRAKGGRRCAAHLAATRGSRQVAMSVSGLASEQVNATFNVLRAEGKGRPEPTVRQYAQFLQRQLNTVNNSNLDNNQRERVRGIFRSATEENLPDGSTFYALSRLNTRARRQSVALRNEITRLAPQIGITRRTAMAQFWRHYQSSASTMNTEVPVGYAGRDSNSGSDLPTDTGTGRALSALRNSANSPEDNPNISPERRIARRGVRNSFISEMGYDREDGRLEVVLRSTPDIVHSYRNVPQSTWNEMNAPGSSPGAIYAYNVRHNTDFEYSNANEAESDAHARRCVHCGQFRAVSHVCPQSRGEVTTPRVAQPVLSTAPQVGDDSTTLAQDVTLPLNNHGEVNSDPDPVIETEIPSEAMDSSLQEAYAKDIDERGEPVDFSRMRNHYHEYSVEQLEAVPFAGRYTSIGFPDSETIADVINNGDVARVKTIIHQTAASSSEENLEIVASLDIYRDENGWTAKSANDYTCVSCANSASDYRPVNNCRHGEIIAQSAHELGQLYRSSIDPQQRTPQTRGARLIMTTSEGNSSPAHRVLNVFQDSETGETNIDEDATGLPHQFNNVGAQQADSIITANPTQVRSALGVGNAIVPVTWRGYRDSDSLPEHMRDYGAGRFNITGEVTLSRDEDGSVSTVDRRLRCTCAEYQRNYHCVHVDYVSNQMPRIGVEDQEAHARIGQMNEMAQVLAERTRQSDWGSDTEYLQAMIDRHDAVAPEDSYSQTFASFKSDLSDAEDKIKNGQSPLEYVTENATGGICAPETGRKFGVELEFDFDPNMSYEDRSQALYKIGQQLHEAGLTTTPDQQEYHAAADSNDYTSWSFEEDCTVSGELVSPIMSDTPEHWAQLQKACEIITNNGGVASARTGSHVHISTGTYGNDVVKHAELANIINQHEDTLYRLATNPEAGTHRPMDYCAPNENLSNRAIENATSHGFHHLGMGHNLGINFESATGVDPVKDNVEFRQWDGSLNPAVIQTQVLLSAGMVEAAERQAQSHGLSKVIREPVGSHDHRQRALLNGSRRKLTEAEQMKDTATTRNFIDTVFTDRAHKKRVTALFAMTKWQKQTSGGTNYDNYYRDPDRDEDYYDYDDYDEDMYYDNEEDE